MLFSSSQSSRTEDSLNSSNGGLELKFMLQSFGPIARGYTPNLYDTILFFCRGFMGNFIWTITTIHQTIIAFTSKTFYPCPDCISRHVESISCWLDSFLKRLQHNRFTC